MQRVPFSSSEDAGAALARLSAREVRWSCNGCICAHEMRPHGTPIYRATALQRGIALISAGIRIHHFIRSLTAT